MKNKTYLTFECFHEYEIGNLHYFVLGDDETGEVICCHKDEIIGHLGFVINKLNLQVKRVHVRCEYRNKGIGRTLYELTLNYAKSLKKLQFLSDNRNVSDSAANIWLKLGAKEYSTKPYYRIKL
jgi:GNAT superfamily N-acetyltransferase